MEYCTSEGFILSPGNEKASFCRECDAEGTKLTNVETEHYDTYPPSLLEFAKAIFDEVSFFGSPEARNNTCSELKSSIEEIESGKAELVPIENIRGYLNSLTEEALKEEQQEVGT